MIGLYDNRQNAYFEAFLTGAIREGFPLNTQFQKMSGGQQTENKITFADFVITFLKMPALGHENFS